MNSAQRSPGFPEPPAAIEQGLAGVELTSWHGPWVPAGSPPLPAQRLPALVTRAFEHVELREPWVKPGAGPGGPPPPAP